MNYALEINSGAVIYIRTKFYDIWFRNSKVVIRGYTYRHRKQGDQISLILFFKSKEGRLMKEFRKCNGNQ
jgi:hypothetical protein